MVVPEVDVVGSVVGLDCSSVGVVVLRPAVRVGAGDVRRRVLVAQRGARRTRGVAVVEPEIVSITLMRRTIRFWHKSKKRAIALCNCGVTKMGLKRSNLS